MTAFERFPRDADDISAENAGNAFAGLIARDAGGLPRVGMLGAGPAVTAVAASWKVQAGPFVYVHQASGAVDFSGLSAAEQVDITPAVGIPAGQGRIDVVCWDRVSAQLVKVEGVASGSPVAPAIGALIPVLQARVNSGDGMVIAGQVTAAFSLSSLAGSGQEGVVSFGAGGSALSSPIFTSPNRTVTFPRPFDVVPKLEATTVANAAAVAQWAQVFNLTKTGFSYRIVSVVAAPQAGVLRWKAEV